MTRQHRVVLELRALLELVEHPHPLNRSQIKRTVQAALKLLDRQAVCGRVDCLTCPALEAAP